MDLARFPRRRYTPFATPIELMPHFTKELAKSCPGGVGPEVWIKRDDMLGLFPGGNKTRKLEFLVGDAMKKSADTLLTHGAVQSNHVRQTAAAAAYAGLRCEAILEERVQDAPTAYHDSGNVFLDQLFDCKLHRVPGGTVMDEALEALAAKLRSQGAKPYVIPGGGSNALGSLGYVDCILELQRQCETMGLRKPHLVHGTGSAGTQAGLVAGVHALGLDWPITGIGVRAPKPVQEQRVYDLAVKVLQLLGIDRPLPREKVFADDNYIGPGYGLPTPAMVEAVQAIARLEGILADPVYTGKGLAGMFAWARAGQFPADADVIFIHTGGAPGLFGYQWAFGKAAA